MEDFERAFVCVRESLGRFFAVFGRGVGVCVHPPWQDREGEKTDVAPDSCGRIAAERREGAGAEGEDTLNGERANSQMG